MRFVISLIAIWVISSGLWLQLIYSAWHQAVDPNLGQIAALDRCDAVFPSRVDGYASQYGESWSSWEASEERDHPECAPTVGALGFLQFVTMQTPQRRALRQSAEDDNKAITRGAVASGVTGPCIILMVGLSVLFLVKARR